MSIPLYEDFADPLGQFHNYDTYDASQKAAIAAQKHVDIRSFIPGPIVNPFNMYMLDVLQMSAIEVYEMRQLEEVVTPYTMLDLDADRQPPIELLTMHQLEGGSLFSGENWTAGTVGPQSDRDNFNGIALNCLAGTTTATQSVLSPIDIADISGSNDYVSLSLPALPSQVTLSTSYLDLTSNPGGDFTIGPTDSLAFSSGTFNSIGSDTEIRFPMNLLQQVDGEAITGVRFRITATSPVTFRCLAIRALAAAWVYLPLDQNTLHQCLVPTPPPTGSLDQFFSTPLLPDPAMFPSTSLFPGTPPLLLYPSPTLYPSPSLYLGWSPFDPWPILVFSDGSTGPTTVSMDVGAIIYTGAAINPDVVSFYFHEFPMTAYSMTALETRTMTELEALLHQPEYEPGTLGDPATTRSLGISFWLGGTSALDIRDEGDNGYTIELNGLVAHRFYYLRAVVEDHTARAYIYSADDVGNVDMNNLIFDSGLIDDPILIPRRPGRFGWFANLGDGDARVSDIRPRETVYEEYRSAPFITTTPTIGARIYPEATPDRELLNKISGINGAVVTSDSERSRSGHSYRIQTLAAPLQGITTNIIRFENFGQSEINFDILAPPTVELAALLLGEGRIYTLFVPPIAANHWSHVVIGLDDPALQPGSYTFALMQQLSISSNWYIDNLSVMVRSVAWEGRQAAQGDPPWSEFGDTINTPFDGLVVGRGTNLQVRGRVLDPDATIYGVKILPQYAQLGNLVWNDE